ncbi:MAG: hypothetical protein KAR65_02685 [Anaerolineales bacterium]|nr:hypothetical protein [Anaerolineales bacterium]MCK5635243.1 hypothetical protein [Anaerolineales bacterium]
MMRTCSRFIAGVFAFLFIISASIALLLYNLDANLLKSDTYKRALTEENIYARMPGFIGEQIKYAMTYNPCLESPDQCEDDSEPGNPVAGAPAYFRVLSDDDWEHLIASLLEPEWLQAMVESVLDQVFDNLNSDAPPEPISISLAELKTKFAGQVGYQALFSLLDKQPTCTPEQILQLSETQLFEGEMDEFVLCNPPENLRDDVDLIMRETIQSAASAIPEEMTFDLPFLDMSGSPDIDVFGGDPIQSVFAARRLLRFTLLIPIAFLLLATVFAVRSIRDWLLWWGVPLLFTGLIGLVFSILSLPILGWAVSRFIGETAPAGVTPDLFSIGVDLGNAVFRQVTRKIMVQAGVITAIGFGFAISAFFVKPAQKEIGDKLPER